MVRRNPSSIALWCIVLGIAAIAASPRGLQVGQFALLGLIAIVIAAYGLVLHEQLAAHPWFATPHPLWHEASEALDLPIEPSVSIVRHQPFFALGASLANMLALVCSLIVCADRKRARQLLTIVAWSGAAYAIYGIGAFLINPTMILLAGKSERGRDLDLHLSKRRGSFLWIVRNHMASSFVRTHSRSVGERSRPVEDGVQWVLLRMVATGVCLFSMLLICLAAMFVTASRGGILLSLIMLVIAVAALFYRDLARRSGLLLVVAIGAIVALVLLEVMGASVDSRLLAQGLGDEGRPATYWSAWHIIRDHPWVGTGLGTFERSLPRLPKRKCFDVGHLGNGAQHAA